MFGHLAPWVIQPEPETVVVRDDKAINILQERLRNLQKTNQENVEAYNNLLEKNRQNYIIGQAKAKLLQDIAEQFNIKEEEMLERYKRRKKEAYDEYEAKTGIKIERKTPDVVYSTLFDPN